MNIPKINQIPLSQPMYVNGQLHQTWINFFEQMGRVADVNGVYSISEMYKSLNTLSDQFDKQDQRINELQDAQTQASKQIDDLTKSVQQTNQSLSELNEKYSSLNEKYIALESRVKVLEDDKK